MASTSKTVEVLVKFEIECEKIGPNAFAVTVSTKMLGGHSIIFNSIEPNLANVVEIVEEAKLPDALAYRILNVIAEAKNKAAEEANQSEDGHQLAVKSSVDNETYRKEGRAPLTAQDVPLADATAC